MGINEEIRALLNENLGLYEKCCRVFSSLCPSENVKLDFSIPFSGTWGKDFCFIAHFKDKTGENQTCTIDVSKRTHKRQAAILANTVNEKI